MDKKENEFGAAVRRIERMEAAFDEVCAVQKKLRMALAAFSEAEGLIRELTDYYEGDWRSDFEADENGELPSGLKRGVLTEDGIWDMLDENRELAAEMKKLINILSADKV